MANEREARLILSLVDQVSGPGRAISAALKGIDRSVRGIDSFGRSVVGMAAAGVAAAGMGRAIGSSVSDAMALQGALGELGIKGDLGDEAVAGIGRRLAEASKASNQSQAALTAGIDAVMGAGLGNDVAVGGIDLIGRTATATNAEVADLAKTLAALNQNLGVAPGREMTKAFEALVDSGNRGAFELKDAAQYFPALSASASALGMKGTPAVAELASWLQIARRGAGDSAEAANNLRNAMAKVLSPETIKNFAGLGVDLPAAIEAGKDKGLSAIETLVRETEKATKGGRAELLGQLFGDEQVRAFLRPAMADLEDYVDLRREAERADGVIDRQMAKRMTSAAARMKRFSLAIENRGLEIGAALLEPIASGADRIARSLNTKGGRVGVLDELATGWKGFAAGLGAGSAGIADVYDAIDRAVFGDLATIEADSDRVGRIFETFKAAGADVRKAAADFQAAAGLGGQMTAIGAGARALVDSLGTGGAVALAAGAVAIGRVGFVLARFALGGTALRLLAVAAGLTGLAGAGDGLGAVDWVGIGVGLAAIAGPLARIARALVGIGKGATAAAATEGRASASKPGSAKAGGIGVGRAITSIVAPLGAASALVDMDSRVAAGTAANGGDEAAALVKVMRENGATTKASVAWLQPYTDAMNSWGRQLMAGAPAAASTRAMPSRAEADRSSMDAMRRDFGPLLTGSGGFQEGIAAADVIDQAGITAAFDGLGAEAMKTGAAITGSLQVTVRPTVDISSIAAAGRAVEGLRAQLASLPGATPSVALERSNSGPDGKRASGGPVRAGLTYVVGERGPETVTMGANGYVTPTHRLGLNSGQPQSAPASSTSNTYNQTFHIASSDPKAAAREVASILGRGLIRSSQIAIDGRYPTRKRTCSWPSARSASTCRGSRSRA